MSLSWGTCRNVFVQKHHCVDSSENMILFNCSSYNFCASFHFLIFEQVCQILVEIVWPIWEKQYHKLHLFLRSRIVQRFFQEFVRDYEMIDLIRWSLLEVFLWGVHFNFSPNKSHKFGDCIVNDSFATTNLDCDFMFWVPLLA